jgi:serine/threonine-protein kinase
MTPDDVRQIEWLYHAARECSPTERPALLARADPELRRQVESLLSQQSGDAFLDRPAIQAAAQLPEDSTVTGLVTGACLGPYRIESKVGEGGMGQVFRAVDTRLGRAVAIKVLSEQFSGRFEREGRAISSINHPHICTLYDVGPNYLVMELVEGETLAARLKKGALPIQQVLEYGAQMAAALSAAHAKGIVHRDLKPGNIMLTKSGVKVLDFGLAKSHQDETVTATRAVMGTPAYMAPEQREGKECDARTDIYALGLVLYEMATGKQPQQNQAFELNRLPEKFEHVVERCLQQEPDSRWQSAKDIQGELEWSTTDRPVRVVRPGRFWVATLALLAILTAGASWTMWRTKRSELRPLIRLSVDLGADALGGAVRPDLDSSEPQVTISPDASRIVYKTRGPNGTAQLATRLLEQAQTTVLPGTENAIDPFFSPDGRWVGFFANGQLKKVLAQGGSAPVTLCSAPRPNGGTWLADGTIVASLNVTSGLSRIPGSGGTPEPLTRTGPGDAVHQWPQILPGQQVVLFTSAPSFTGFEYARIDALSLSTRHRRTVLAEAYFGQYLPSGHLVYMHDGVLFGVPFDPDRLQVRGTPTPLLDDVAAYETHAYLNFSAAPSGSGTFLYRAVPRSDQLRSIVWLDSKGKTEPLVPTASRYSLFRFSPDGRRLALTENDHDIVVYDLQRATKTRITFTGHEQSPVWAPDGRHIVFQSRPTERYGLSWTNADGASEAHVLLDGGTFNPYSFSPDGKHLLYQVVSSNGGQDLWTLPLDLTDPDHPKPGKPEPFLDTRFNETVGVFSPDGRWIAYRSDESGTNEIYVRPFPRAEGKWHISTGGGRYAFWSKSTPQLFYLTLDNHIMVLDYTTNRDMFVPASPRVWFDEPVFAKGFDLDLALDGIRFAVLSMPHTNTAERSSAHVTFLLNFFDELRRRIPPGGK